MKDLQQTIQSLLDELTASGKEHGLQFTAYRHGKKVIDACSGIADPRSGRTVDHDTLFPIFSTTKGIAATLIHILVERGKVEYDTPIGAVWPEFAAHGKDKITLRHALNHTAGLPNMPVGIGHAELGDWDVMCRLIADLHPISPPGMEMRYHAITYGWLLGEVARRVDGRSFGRLLRDEIGAPLGIADGLFVGIPDEMEARVAILGAEADPSAHQPLPNDATPQAIPALVQPLHDWMNRPDARRACLPASTGIANARAIARHYAALLPGGVDGIELLPPTRIAWAIELQKPGNSRGEPPPMAQALGYQLGAGPLLTRAFGHGGYGGSAGFADPESGWAYGYTRNYFAKENAVNAILDLLLRDG